jgi:uncharacterized protein (TIGR00251 family)
LVRQPYTGEGVDGHGPGRETTASTTILRVRVVPGASRSEIVGADEGTLKIRLAAPPIKGKANRELVKVLAKALGLKSRDVEIVSGHRSRLKQVRVRGVDPRLISKLVENASQTAR